MALIAGTRLYRGAGDSLPDVPVATLEESAVRLCEMNQQAERRGVFIQFADRVGGELMRGEVGLATATERLFYFCLQNYPEYMENIWTVEPGRNIKTKIANNLVRTLVKAEEPPNPSAERAALLGRLDRELRELPYEAAGER
jgi:hypothetical protein